jgi:tetratricopeptide (TPR) repeat protein
MAAGKMIDAKRRVDALTSYTINSHSFQSELGELLTTLQDYPAALLAYQKSLDLKPNQPGCHFNMAVLLRFLGEFEQAERECNRVIELDPLDGEVYLLRSELRTQTEHDNHIAELRRLLESRQWPWRSKMHLCYSLAKEYEDLGSYPQSFTYLKQGAELRRSQMQYRVSSDEQTIDKIIAVYDKSWFEKPTVGCDSLEPIFIVGLPRTGTTLLDRILSSHSQVTSAGELNNFSQQLLHQVYAKGNVKNKTELVARTVDLDFAKLGADYIQSTRPFTGETACFTDKLPLNFLYVGLIGAALPNAKIIHLTRDPMDACYAIYKKLFKNAYPFSYDLDDLGRYFLAYRRLMEHWEAVMPGRIYHLSYETLVEDTERQTSDLLEYCGLSWQDACLRFHENTQASTTASAVQVRTPMYTSSVGNWKNYSEQLASLQRILEKGNRPYPMLKGIL